MKFERSLSETTLYIEHKENDILIVSLYVDYLLVTGNNAYLVGELKKEMTQGFEMTDLGLMTYLLGMEVKKN